MWGLSCSLYLSISPYLAPSNSGVSGSEWIRGVQISNIRKSRQEFLKDRDLIFKMMDESSNVIMIIMKKALSLLEDCVFFSLLRDRTKHFHENIKSEIVLCGSLLFAPAVHMVAPSPPLPFDALLMQLIHSDLYYNIWLTTRQLFYPLTSEWGPPFAMCLLHSRFTTAHLLEQQWIVMSSIPLQHLSERLDRLGHVSVQSQDAAV